MKRKWLWGIAAIGVVAVIGANVYSSGRPVDVDLYKVTEGSMEKVVEEKGEVRLTHQMDINSTVSGIVTETLADVGDKVKKGQILLRFDAKNLQLQIADLEAQISGARARYKEAVKPAKVSEMNKLESAIRAAELAYENAQRQVANNTELLDSGAISQDALETSKIDLAAKESALMTARSNLDLAKGKVSNNLKDDYASQIQSLESRLAILKNQLDDMTVVAGTEGILISMDAKVGDYMNTGSLLAQIGSTEALYLSADVLAEDMPGIEVGTAVRLTNDDLGIVDAPAKVINIHPTAISKLSDLGIVQKRVTVEIDPTQPIKGLRAGYELTAEFIVSSKDKTLLIDKKALFQDQGKDMVFLNDGGIAKPIAIGKGLENDRHIEVLNGLSAGQEVVVSPSESIKEGTRIQ